MVLTQNMTETKLGADLPVLARATANAQPGVVGSRDHALVPYIRSPGERALVIQQVGELALRLDHSGKSAGDVGSLIPTETVGTLS